MKPLTSMNTWRKLKKVLKED